MGGVTGCAALPAPLPDPAGADTRLPLPVPIVASGGGAPGLKARRLERSWVFGSVAAGVGVEARSGGWLGGDSSTADLGDPLALAVGACGGGGLAWPLAGRCEPVIGICAFCGMGGVVAGWDGGATFLGGPPPGLLAKGSAGRPEATFGRLAVGGATDGCVGRAVVAAGPFAVFWGVGAFSAGSCRSSGRTAIFGRLASVRRASLTTSSLAAR